MAVIVIVIVEERRGRTGQNLWHECSGSGNGGGECVSPTRQHSEETGL